MGLTAFRDHQIVRAWKGMDWALLDAWHERGWITDPIVPSAGVGRKGLAAITSDTKRAFWYQRPVRSQRGLAANTEETRAGHRRANFS